MLSKPFVQSINKRIRTETTTRAIVVMVRHIDAAIMREIELFADLEVMRARERVEVTTPFLRMVLVPISVGHSRAQKMRC